MTVSIDSFIFTLEVILLYALLEPANGKNVCQHLTRHCTSLYICRKANHDSGNHRTCSIADAFAMRLAKSQASNYL